MGPVAIILAVELILMPLYITIGMDRPDPYHHSQASAFWTNTNLSTKEIKHYLNLVLKNNESKNDSKLKFYISDPNSLEKKFVDIDDDHIKKFRLENNEYIAVNLSAGTTIGEFYLFSNDHIIYHSSELGYVSNIQQNANHEIVIKGNDSGTGTYKESGFIIKQIANEYRLVGAYPIKGYMAPAAGSNEYIISFNSQPLPNTRDQSKRFLINISLDMKAGNAKNKVSQYYGLNKNSKKSCEFVLAWNKAKKHYVSNVTCPGIFKPI